MSKTAIRQLLAERSRRSRDEDEDEESFWDRHKGKIIGGIALAGAAGFAAHKFSKGKAPAYTEPFDKPVADSKAYHKTLNLIRTTTTQRANILNKMKSISNTLRTTSWTGNQNEKVNLEYEYSKLQVQERKISKVILRHRETFAKINHGLQGPGEKVPAPGPSKTPAPKPSETTGATNETGGVKPKQESTNIKHFIKMLGESDYSGADSYLKQIVNDKLQSKISKQYQLQKLY